MPEDRNIVIAGAGGLGLATVELLNSRGHDIIVVERSSQRCAEISDQYLATIIEGDATRPDILEQALKPRAYAIAALTSDVPANLAICMVARKITEEIFTVMRGQPGTGEEYSDLVDRIIIPERAAAKSIANAIFSQQVHSLEEVTEGLEILTVEIGEDAPAAGKQLNELQFPEGSLIISSQAGRQIVRGDTVFHAGEQYVVAVEPDVTAEVIQLLRG